MKKTSKEEILQKAIELFKQNGYHKTSMANIADACGLIKGSIYHHFKSKDDIGIEALKYIHEYFVKNIYAIAYDETLEPKKRLEQFVNKANRYFLQSEGGCLFGNLALELPKTSTSFKDEIRLYFLEWEKALITIFETKYSEKESKALAKEYVALTQGAIMMMNLYEDEQAYLAVGEKIITLL